MVVAAVAVDDVCGRRWPDRLPQACQGEPIGSFLSENCGGLTVRVVGASGVASGLEIEGMTLPANSLGVGARGTRFSQCYFQSTEVRAQGLIGAEFQGCEFDHLELLEPEALIQAESAIETLDVDRQRLAGGARFLL